MSGLIKGAKRVFKKVTKVIKRVAPIALAAGAIFFTAGAALSTAIPAWGAAASSLTSGLSGTLGSVVTGAVTQAGQAAAIGGILSEATGGKFSEGAKAGAVTGGLLGGIGGYMNAPTTPVSDGTGGKFANMSPAQAQPDSFAAATQGASNPMGAADFARQSSNTPGLAGGAQNFGQSAKGLLSGIGQFAKDNPEITGSVIQGLGAGLSAQAQADELRKAQRREQRSYEGLDYSGYRQFEAPQQTQQSTQPGRYSYEYAYNPQTARIERRQRA